MNNKLFSISGTEVELTDRFDYGYLLSKLKSIIKK